jgi:hypothetical protein
LEEWLVPIRLDVDVEGIRIKDVFTYNMNETLIGPRQLALILAADFELTQSASVELMATRIHEQIVAHRELAKQQQQMLELNQQGKVLIQLDILEHNMSYIDQFEFSVPYASTAPELVANALVQDLSLPPSFVTCIAHAIREQADNYIKRTRKQFTANEAAVQDYLSEELLQLGLQASTFQGPVVARVARADMDKDEKDRERDARRKRREAARKTRNQTTTTTTFATRRTPLPGNDLAFYKDEDLELPEAPRSPELSDDYDEERPNSTPRRPLTRTTRQRRDMFVDLFDTLPRSVHLSLSL